MKIDGLEASVASAAVRKNHAPLVAALKQHEQLLRARFLISRTHYSERAVRVIDREGHTVATDLHLWLRELVDRAGGDVTKAWRDALGLGYAVIEVQPDKLVLTHDRLEEPDGIVHVFVTHMHSPKARALFAPEPWREPRTFDDLVGSDARGDYIDRAVDVPDRYVLHSVVDVGAFMAEADQINGATQVASARRTLVITDGETGAKRESTLQAEHPELFKFPWSGRRFFDDWMRSSAGQGGRRVSEHWFFETQDWNDGRSPRAMSITPQWGFRGLIAKVEARGSTAYGVYDKLLKLDQRVGVPFGWFFYMLHGNRVTQEAAHAVVEAAEEGKIFMQERDYRVLKDWQTVGYAF